MKRYDLLTTSLLAFALIVPTACDDGGDEETTSTTENAEETTDTNSETTEETGPDMEITCAIYCVAYIEGECFGTEFELNDQCLAACEGWDPEGRACRYEQVIMGNCAEAGTMGTTCE